MRWLFFSFEGRINRAIWWAVVAGTLFLDVGIFLLTFDWESQTLTLAVGLVALALRIAPSVKRLHDRNKSGAWLWLYFGAPQAFLALSLMAVDVETASLLAFLTFGLLIAVIIDLGAIVGTPGNNRFGPDPLAQGTTGGP